MTGWNVLPAQPANIQIPKVKDRAKRALSAHLMRRADQRAAKIAPPVVGVRQAERLPAPPVRSALTEVHP